MTNTKWLRRALLGGVALGVMATGAHADELAELKAQLEGLQNRVNQLEQQPNMAALPEGVNFLTFNRGSAGIKTHLDRSTLNHHNDVIADRGFTIAITPSADLPAPVAEVVVYGFVKGDFIYSIDNDTGNVFSIPELFSEPSGDLDNDHLRAHAFQTRFGIRSRADTAIGQIRTQIEGDFFSAPFDDPPGNFRLRHAFGEWDLMPNWTFLAGQTTRTAVLVPIGVPTVDFGYSAGVGSFPRAMQVRMTYHAGPISWAVAVEKPTRETEASWPDLSAYVQFDAPGGHEFIVSGSIQDRDRRDLNPLHTSRERDRGGVGWVVGAGANIRIMDIATLSTGVHYGENGGACAYILQEIGCYSQIDSFKDVGVGGTFLDFYGADALAFQVGLSFNVTDTTTFNVQYGYSTTENLLRRGDFPGIVLTDYRPASRIESHTVHANILWQPVRQMRLGWEVMWGEYNIKGGDSDFVFLGDDWERGSRSKDALRAQFGAWFFF
jgi:hypothetical protein